MVLRELADGLNRNPAIRMVKTTRNALVDTYFRRLRRADGEALAARLKAEAAGRVCFTVAFNAPWVIDLLTAAWAKYGGSFRLVVVDNSKSAESRILNRRICEARSVPYLGLPRNPEWSPNRSHGISMNWIYHNIVLNLEPAEFGFIDHDCFPIKAFDLAGHLAGKSAYGWRRFPRNPRYRTSANKAWNLWAGFCFYRFADTLAEPLNFNHRIEQGLDTGGGNWDRLYSRLDEDQVGIAAIEKGEVPLGDEIFRYDLIDGAFIHVGGASYRSVFKARQLRTLIWDHMWSEYLAGQSPVLPAP